MAMTHLRAARYGAHALAVVMLAVGVAAAVDSGRRAIGCPSLTVTDRLPGLGSSPDHSLGRAAGKIPAASDSGRN